MPERIVVGPYVYAVSLDEALDDANLHGVTNNNLHNIRLNPANPPDVQRVTALHEVLHAVCCAAGIDDAVKLSQEQFISRIEAPLASVLRDNPDFVAFILAT